MGAFAAGSRISAGTSTKANNSCLRTRFDRSSRSSSALLSSGLISTGMNRGPFRGRTPSMAEGVDELYSPATAFSGSAIVPV